MVDKKIIQSKNVKRFYVPRILVIYLSDSDLSIFQDFSRNAFEYANFAQIGSSNPFLYQKSANHFNGKFYSWIQTKKHESRIMKPSTFFRSQQGIELMNQIKDMDIEVLVYKSSRLTNLEYVAELIQMLDKNDVFTFHFVLENFIQPLDTREIYEKMIKSLKRKRQLYIPIQEEVIVSTYKNATISTRNYYANLYINNLIDLFISPFLDPKRNPDAFSKTKALFYKTKRNFETKIVTSIGYSEDPVDNAELALIQALSSPMFAAAFEASNTFIVSVKMPYFTEEAMNKLETILKLVVGEWKQFYILTYTGRFDFAKYCQVSIMAINVDESKLIKDADEIQQSIKKILINVQKSKNLFDSKKTQEFLLNKESKIDALEG